VSPARHKKHTALRTSKLPLGLHTSFNEADVAGIAPCKPSILSHQSIAEKGPLADEHGSRDVKRTCLRDRYESTLSTGKVVPSKRRLFKDRIPSKLSLRPSFEVKHSRLARPNPDVRSQEVSNKPAKPRRSEPSSICQHPGLLGLYFQGFAHRWNFRSIRNDGI
jgi:hypothetical protein